MLTKLIKDSAGAAAIEYALLISLASLGIITGAANIGRSSSEPIDDVSDCLEGSSCTAAASSTGGSSTGGASTGGGSTGGGAGANHASSGGNNASSGGRASSGG